MNRPAFNLRKATIYSLSPWLLTPQFRPYAPDPKGGATIFKMPVHSIADLRSEKPPKSIDIYDSFQAQMGVHMSIDVAKQHESPHFVFIDFIVADLLQHWGRQGIGVPGECGPGVWASQGPESLGEEIQLNHQRLIQYAEFLYNQAKEFEEMKQFTNISKPHRIAAAVLEREEFWSKTAMEKIGSTEKCPLCMSTMITGAYICPACTRQIREFPADLARLNQNAPETATRRNR